MQLTTSARQLARRILLGSHYSPQQAVVGMPNPQTAVTVFLHGAGAPRDVSGSHMLACAAPFTVGIAVNPPEPLVDPNSRLWLSFRERDKEDRLLGKLELQVSAQIPLADGQLQLYRVRRCANYCLPIGRRLTHRLYDAYRTSRHPSPIPMRALEVRSTAVFYLCPRPLALVSLPDGTAGNVFPMDLMGPTAEGYFSFALNSTTPVASLVQRTGKLALSDISLDQWTLARDLGKNHRREAVPWEQFPFLTRTSPTLQIPVPWFAQRLRELCVERIQSLGSHTLFTARVLRDEVWMEGPSLFLIDGNYQAWRQHRKLSSSKIVAN